jgi:protein tyrosine phosphatase
MTGPPANSNIKLDYTYTNGSLKTDDNGNASVTGMKSGSLNFLVTDQKLAGLDGGSKTFGNGVAFSFIDIKGLGSGGGPNGANYFVNSNVFEHELGQQFIGTQTPRNYAQDAFRQFVIDGTNTTQGWGSSNDLYRLGLQPASFAAPTNPQQ